MRFLTKDAWQAARRQLAFEVRGYNLDAHALGPRLEVHDQQTAELLAPHPGDRIIEDRMMILSSMILSFRAFDKRAARENVKTGCYPAHAILR